MRRAVAASWPALAAWAAALATLWITAAALSYAPFSAETWARWDSVLYLDVARDGYDLFRCDPEQYPAGSWCGDAGWFPAYAWLVGALHLVGLPLPGAAVAVSWLAAGGTLLLLWHTFLGRRLAWAPAAALLYAAFVPGQIYDYAVFPLSLLALFTIAHLWLLDRGRWVAAGLAGAGAALSYPVGVVLAPVSALWILLAVRRDRLRALAASALTACGFAVFLLDQRLETGRWNAYFLVQDKYEHSLRDPFEVAWGAMQLHGTALSPNNAPAFQTMLVTAVLVAVLAELVLRRRTATRLDVLLAIWAVVTWAFPLTQANVSVYRSQAALLPLALLVRRLPRPALVLAVAGALVLSVPMARLFVEGKLV
jgi:hypothetical protein